MIPPRLCDRETAVVPWNDFAVEEKRIETAALRGGIAVETKIDPPRQRDRPIHVRLEIGDETRIIDDLAITVDDAGKARSVLADRAEDCANARFAVGGCSVKRDRKVEAPQRSVSAGPLTEIASKPAARHELRHSRR
jgi:hypothetical protein